MNMYNIVICDDEKEILKKIASKIRSGFEKFYIDADYTFLTDARKLVDIVENRHIDILFLDIDMPYFSGMDIAGIIREKGLETLLVFVTGYDTLVYKTFAYKPFAFLRKSYFDEEVDEVIERLVKELIALKEELIIKKGHEVVKIIANDIYYIESEGNYINIYTVNGKEKCRKTLADIEKELAGKNFIRCHKGYLINMKYISRVKSNEAELTEGSLIPIGRSYEKEMKKKILESFRK